MAVEPARHQQDEAELRELGRLERERPVHEPGAVAARDRRQHERGGGQQQRRRIERRRPTLEPPVVDRQQHDHRDRPERDRCELTAELGGQPVLDTRLCRGEEVREPDAEHGEHEPEEQPVEVLEDAAVDRQHQGALCGAAAAWTGAVMPRFSK